MRRRSAERGFFTLFMRYWLPVLVYVTLIVVISAQPRLRPPIQFTNADKVYHVIEYLGLGILLVRALRASLTGAGRGVVALIALTTGIVVGTGDEFLQSFIPGREPSGLDLLADTVGLALAQLAFLVAARE